MKKHLSLILCLAMILTFVPFGTVLASEDTATEGTDNPTYISETIDISKSSSFSKMAFGKIGETFAMNYHYLYADLNQSFIFDIEKFKANTELTWKEDWTEGKTDNVLVRDGVDYAMILKSNGGSSALDVSGANIPEFSVTENYYEKINILANGAFNSQSGQYPIGVILTYKDGTQVYKQTQKIYFGCDTGNLKNQTYWNGFESGNASNSGMVSDAGTVAERSDSSNLNVYSVEVNPEKILNKIQFIGNNKIVTEANGACTISDRTSADAQQNAVANVFAVTAVTTQETLDAVVLNELKTAVNAINVDALTYDKDGKNAMEALGRAYRKCQKDNIAIDSETQTAVDNINAKWDAVKPISTTIDISANAKTGKRAFAKENDSILLYYNYLYNHSNEMRHIMDINSLKNNISLNWADKDFSTPINTLSWNGIDYKWYIDSASNNNAGGALDLSGWNYYTYNVTETYYDKISMFANGGAIGTPEKGIGVILTYSDGTTEYKTTSPVYEGLDSNVKSSSYWNGFEVDGLWINTANYVTTAGTAMKTSATTHYINTYEVAVDNQKTLKSVTVMARGVEAQQDGNRMYSPKVDTTNSTYPHANTNIFAITAVTTQETYKKNKPINETIDLSKDYHILAYTDYNKTFEVKYDHLGQYSNFAISLQNMKNDYTWDNDYNVLTWNGVKYYMPVRQSVSAVKDNPEMEEDETVQKVAGAINNGGNKAFTYSVTPSYYEKINVMANGYGGKYSQLQDEDITSGAVIKLIYEDGTSEYKETETVYQYTNGNIEKESFYSAINTIKVPAVKLTGLNNGCLGTATSESQNYSDQYGEAYVYIQPYEITVDSTKRLTSVTVVGTSSEADAEYIAKRKQEKGYDIANTNIFAMTAITSNSIVETSANAEISTILGTLSKDNLTYNSENFEKISKLTKLLALCEENGYTVEKETDAKGMLTAWENCQKATMQVVPISYERIDNGNAVTLSVTAKAIENITDAVVIFAIYDKTNNKLLEVYNENKNFETTSAASLSHTFDTSSYDATQYVVKCFVWNSLTGEDALKAYMYSVEK